MAGIRPTVLGLAAQLAAGQTTSRELIEQALARIADPAGEGARTFISVYADSAREAADGHDKLRKAGYVPSVMAGLPVSIKDLFDVKGEVTRAGSVALADAPPAEQDCPVVARLRRAGAILIGRTNMTEFAFSGVGINPHYGTPGNPYDRKRVPGGSSSGAAVSIADGCAVVALGTDTGGSVRIPAALCGVVGFKPTQRRIPRDGVYPLSTTLDSVGPLAGSVACCALTDAVIAGEQPHLPATVELGGLRIGIPRTWMLDDLAPEVARAFDRACAALSRAGARLIDLPLTELAEFATLNARGGLSPLEAYTFHADLLERCGDQYDPRVRIRLTRGREISGVDYLRLHQQRADFIARVDRQTAAMDVLLAPTAPIIAPPIAAFERDEEFFRLNGLLLRNTVVVNFLDRCAVSIPIHAPGEAPVGLMVIGPHDGDRRLLGIAMGIEQVFGAQS